MKNYDVIQTEDGYFHIIDKNSPLPKNCYAYNTFSKKVEKFMSSVEIKAEGIFKVVSSTNKDLGLPVKAY